MFQDYNEPTSDSEDSDQASDGSEGFDEDPREMQTHDTGTYAILSINENGTHRTTLLECVKVTICHPTDQNKQCETVMLLDSASDHTYFKQSLSDKLQLPNLGSTS